MGNVAGHVRHLTADVSCTKIFLSITLTNWQPTSSLPTNISNDKTHTKDFLLLQSYRSCFDDIPATYHESADKLHQSERLRFEFFATNFEKYTYNAATQQQTIINE